MPSSKMELGILGKLIFPRSYALTGGLEYACP
jgi:hypothetical protein